MSLEKYTQEEIQEMSMIDIAYEIMLGDHQAKNFQDMYQLVAEAKEFSQKEKEQYISQFYTDLNIDGRFLSVGSNLWGLKHWYPFDQTVEDAFVAEEKPKKKQKKKKKDKAEEPAAEDETLLEDDIDTSGEESESEELFEDEVDDLEKNLDKGDEEEDL
ncbi:DNA-directed RNA polymerase subunit delta [Alkalibacillus salilacus]|uniref:Probable DNA-directed RNA polymerase subunit delta n=1 Tax=Alkalibacillus salilacus TaxID=284582 RepID=A0ABT9VI38_9BACI|nr:DNA-directed RNA polymerase subunit delta [Alkalibacillus salilacus]MDQ0160579.1 DNA-directed RNA polymerase subunit delta [Alkalibacillus salilacus]